MSCYGRTWRERFAFYVVVVLNMDAFGLWSDWTWKERFVLRHGIKHEA